ncbi:MAG: monovalent cation/H+ antiporter complex subunit F [Candidatus Omnitrophota bacterium]
MKFLRWLFVSVILTSIIVSIFVILPVTALTKFILYLLLCFLLALLRIIKGPTPADRAIAVDIIGILVVGFCAIMTVYTERAWYIDIAIAWALQSFIGTLALAKFLEGKNFDE